MHTSIATLLALSSAIFGSVSEARYGLNCKGSSYQPVVSDCRSGISTIDAHKCFPVDSQFSYGTSYIKYTGSGCGWGEGKALINTSNEILNACEGHGSYGTDDGNTCHITINYRS